MILDSVPSSAVYATALGSAARATVEERPFQGRVTNEVKMGFSPRGPLRVSHRAEAHIKGRLTRR